MFKTEENIKFVENPIVCFAHFPSIIFRHVITSWNEKNKLRGLGDATCQVVFSLVHTLKSKFGNDSKN